ncbi:hypothetical protein [Companilactobacillus pabuli]|uniref:Uncharacterized protein n=1 Tax=Companilactobacillus pabuli TaxID=2714036 RepID=A0A7L7KW26_9LACO|nr:hypothetical protein [Companilactobacillus pabuli]AKP03141.1 hypothetical protein ABB45_05560 [Companilactobacillus farciminis]AKS51441.1 hypothetical protein ABB44_05570 [Companilactobacillus farciminis]MDG5112231.1 hypothetical protein [Companilactobacillus pabuli]QMT83204.1 hypothetical protein G6534_00395 [Companilactobacillus pabuli]
MKVRILLKSYLQLYFQNFLYLTMLFSIIVFGLLADHLLEIGNLKKFSLLLIAMFLLSLFSTMNLYYNDSQQNKYLKQKINSHFADWLSQLLVAVIANLFSSVLIFIFSLILDSNILLDFVGISSLFSVGFLGSGIATLFQTQWYNHSTVGQIGALIFTYLAFSGSVVSILTAVEWLLPPLSKIIITLQNTSSITKILPIVGQTLLYAIILFFISGLVYKKNRKNA